MKHIFFTFIFVLGFGFSVFAQSNLTSCPTIDVAGGGVNSGNPMEFSVVLSDQAKNFNLQYLWTVSEGKIVEGQGTSSIKVDTTGLFDSNVTATVEIKGLPENCPNTDSETGSVVICYKNILIDEFARIRDNEIKEKIGNLFLKLGEIPASQGYIINYGTDKEIAAREKQIQRAISFLKYDTSRVTIVRGGLNPNGEGIWTKVWIVPPGANNPQP